jgi:nitroreductase
MTGAAVPQDQVDQILAATNLAATSYGLQPFSVLVVTNQPIKEKLQAAAYGQQQLGESSHVLAFCVPEKLTSDDFKAYMENIAATRGLPLEALSGFEGMIEGTVGKLTPEQQQIWSAKQAYIALGTALAAAAELKVDACPMEGFDANQFDEILGLKEKGLKTVVIMPIGFRSEEDASQHYKKVRKDSKDIFHMIN